MVSRRLFLIGSVAGLSGCAGLSKFKSEVVSDFELCKKGITSFIDNAEIKAKALTKDFEKLIIAKVALAVAENSIKKGDGSVRSIIKNALFYIEDAAIVSDFILTYVPAPFPVPLIVKAIKTLTPVIASFVGESEKYKAVYTGMTPDQARQLLSSL